MATITIGPTNGATQKYDVAYIGASTVAINATNFPWYTSTKVASIYSKAGNRQGYTSIRPGQNLPSLTQFVPVTTGLTPNVYELNIRAQVTLDTAQFYVVGATAPLGNQLPIVNAGSDIVITAPTSSVALMGTASDPDTGDTLTYAWRQVSGPNNATGLPATSLNVVVTNLVTGAYQFGFQATDQKGGKSPEDFVVVTINAGTSSGIGGRYASEDYFSGDYNAY
jgi:hypothetical protein